jgi:hypothetical protein
VAQATKDRKTEKKASALYQSQIVANALAARKYYAGTMQVIDAAGRADNPSVANAALRVGGVVKLTVDNLLGANDAEKVELETGEFKFAKDGATPPTAADIGKTVFASDNQTISRSAAAGSPAGVLTEVETDGVMVGVGPQYSAAPNAAV